MLVEQNLKSQQAFIMSFPGAQIVWAVEVAVGDSFHDVVGEDVVGEDVVGEDVVGEDVVAAFEVGDGAGDFEDAVVGACRHVHAFHGIAQFF